jgi:hypothetical protein
MSTHAPSHHKRTYKAAADLSTKQWYACKLSTTVDKAVDVATGATAATDFIGVIESPGVAPRAGASPGITTLTTQENVAVVWGGMTRALSGAAITRGALVTVNTAGKFIAATTGTVVVGRAEESVGAADRIFSLLLVKPGPAMA